MTFSTRPHPLTRRASGLALLALAATLGAPALAQDKYPNRVIKVIVPFPAGTAPDVMARFWGERLSKALGQGVVVDNKPGASTIVGTQQFVAAPADGYTLLYTASGTVSINPFAYKKLPYQASDLVPVIQTLSIPLVVSVANASPYKTLADLIKDAKDHPNKVSYASYGVATAPHVSMAYFANSANISLNHVPYKDGGLNDIVGGAVDTAFSPIADVLQFIKTGRVRALAVSSKTRLESLPQVPTVGEFFPGFEGDSWHGVFALKGTPQAAIDQISAASQKIVASDEYKKYLGSMGLVPIGGTQENFAAVLQSDSKRWVGVIKNNNISLD
ncbi:tripartite tricarboxylate transporter substrate binding protein [Curvibacter sp. RS43]|uniref:Tripartite tricarboxylate transporter substrate binding protein n=1 Tax=Curvibacter microcysteis TaxID=3026419 RepID=A0ABT5MGV1_9BURK|nr:MULTISPECIES: tripartite tricarboxylate transporter substrate binding protein [unclassified Curvibacter]MDD0812213.1 tripartite tricarboxylate transporter substrate binding protein [Curvibacter sp. RS43]MDD0815814.1 tripartite tricarboxylate transporter substrate binding protein [Curvibacter sp. HBC28]